MMGSLALLATVGARAETSVSLYGLVDMGLSVQTHSPNAAGTYAGGSSVGLTSGGQSANRIGLRGSEDLGDGTQLNFVLESGFNLGNGRSAQGGRLFGRQSWIGVQSALLGYVRLGRQYNFSYDYVGVLSPSGAGDFSRATLGASYGSGGTERLSNMLKLETASMLGFKVGLGYSFSTQVPSVYAEQGRLPVQQGATNGYEFSTVDNLRALSAGTQYTNGPLYLTAVREVFFPNVSTAGNQVANATSWTAGGMYDFGAFRLSAAYGQIRNGWLNPLQPVHGTDDSIGLDNRNRSIIFDSNIAAGSYQVGLIFPVSAISNVFGIWHLVKPTGSMQANSAFAVSAQNVYTVGYTYNFTKRTNLYAYSAYATSYSLVQGMNSATVGIGVRHKF